MSDEIAIRSTGTALAPVPDAVAELYPALADPAEIFDIMQSNLSEGETMGIGSLTRVVNPSGKSVSFIIPNIEGDDVTAQTVEGIIIGWQEGRTYYESADAKDGTPPDCSSRDGVNGYGEYGKDSEANPSGLCADCPMGQWVRGAKGEEDIPPPCKQMTNVLLLTDEEAFPYLVRVPRASLTNFRKYRQGLLKKLTPITQCVTVIGLQKATNTAGTAYAEFTFKMGEKYDKATRAAAAAFGNKMVEVLNATPTPMVQTQADEGGVSIGDTVVDEDLGPSDEDMAEYVESETSAQAAS